MNYKEIEQEMEKTYDGICNKYLDEAKADWEDKKYVDRFINYLAPNSSILDIACGTGELLRYYSDLGFKTTGIDISQQMVSVSKKRIPEAKILKMSLYDIDKIEEKFDAISATFIFVHIPKENIRDVLKNIKDKLRPGGIFFTVYTTSLQEGLQEEPLDSNYKFYGINHNKDEITRILQENEMEVLDVFSEDRINKLPVDVIIAKRV